MTSFVSCHLYNFPFLIRNSLVKCVTDWGYSKKKSRKMFQHVKAQRYIYAYSLSSANEEMSASYKKFQILIAYSTISAGMMYFNT